MGDDPSRKSKLNGQMIPLTEATTVAYDIILRRAPLLHDSRDLEESRGLVALALSALATIYAVGDGGEAVPLSPAEIEEQLFFPTAQGMRDRTKAPNLAELYMRRDDLIRAVENLKAAHASRARSDDQTS